MPNVTVHLLLAERVLAGWAQAPSAAPFDPLNPAARNAFVQGSFGPDIGYFPGSDAFLSDLAHYVGTADLTRSLFRRAHDDEERAFAWGWLAHVLADQSVHPLVGEAAWQLKTGQRGGFLGISQDPVTHVRVEVGLDAHVSRLRPHLRDRRGVPVFDRASVAFLAGAYRDTYGLEVDPSLLLASHHAAVRMANHALAAIGVLGSTLPGGRGVGGAKGVGGRNGTGGGNGTGGRNPIRGENDARFEPGLGRRFLDATLEALDGTPAGGSMILAFLRLVPPSPWLVERVKEVVEGFPGRLALFGNGGLEDLPNFNLDTGRIQELGPGSLRAESTRAILARIGARAKPSRNGGTPASIRYTGAVRAPGEV